MNLKVISDKLKSRRNSCRIKIKYPVGALLCHRHFLFIIYKVDRIHIVRSRSESDLHFLIHTRLLRADIILTSISKQSTLIQNRSYTIHIIMYLLSVGFLFQHIINSPLHIHIHIYSNTFPAIKQQLTSIAQ